VFVFQPEDDEEVYALANPEIVERGDETEIADEGCLSIQGITVPVERSLHVVITGLDENGEHVRFDLDGYSARCVQHETDHLDGVLMLGRTTPEARREALGRLRPSAPTCSTASRRRTRSRSSSRGRTSRGGAVAPCRRRRRSRLPSGSGSRCCSRSARSGSTSIPRSCRGGAAPPRSSAR